MTTDPKSVEEALARFVHMLNSAQSCIRVGELEAAEQQLMKARELAPARAELYDTWAELEDHRARPEEACRRRRTAWELEATPRRGLALAEDLPEDQTSEFLAHIVQTFPDSVEAVVAWTRHELGQGGFEAGDRASSILVKHCPGGSQELMAAMVQVIAGLHVDQEAMDIFQPLVSADITRRHSIESGALDPNAEPLPVVEHVDEGDPFADLPVHAEALPPAPEPEPEPEPDVHYPPPPPVAPPPISPPPAPTLAQRRAEDTRDRPSNTSSTARVIHPLPPLPPEDERDYERAKKKTKKKPGDWRLRLWPYAPLLGVVPALALAFWVGFGDGYDWMIRERHDKLLLYFTLPTVCFLGGIGVGIGFGRQAGYRALIGGALGSMVLSSVAFLLLGMLVGALQPSILVESLMIFGTCVAVWGGLGAVGVKVCS